MYYSIFSILIKISKFGLKVTLFTIHCMTYMEKTPRYADILGVCSYIALDWYPTLHFMYNGKLHIIFPLNKVVYLYIGLLRVIFVSFCKYFNCFYLQWALNLGRPIYDDFYLHVVAHLLRCCFHCLPLFCELLAA